MTLKEQAEPYRNRASCAAEAKHPSLWEGLHTPKHQRKQPGLMFNSEVGFITMPRDMIVMRPTANAER